MTAVQEEASALASDLRSALEGHARRGETVTYIELAVELGLSGAQRIHRVTLALEALIRADHDAGRPLLASLAVSRTRSGLPGDGYFLLLQTLGRYEGPTRGPAAAALHERELASVFRTFA